MSDAIIKSVNTGGRGITSYMQYDALNRLISVDDASIDTDGSRVLVGYDGFGNIIEYENEEGAVTLYEYDLDGRLISATDAPGAEATFTYGAMDRVATVTEANGAVTVYRPKSLILRLR